MVAPFTGYTKQNFTQFSDHYVVGVRQKRPYDTATEYRNERSEGMTRTTRSSVTQGNWDITTGDTSFNASTDLSLESARHLAAAYSKAYERFADKVGDTAGWAENFAQFGKTMDMIANRGFQMYNFAKNLRKGNFAAAAGVLKTPIPQKVSKKKALSQNFLEWEYGWSPLLRDISTSVSILTDTDFGVRKLEASAKASNGWASITRSPNGDGELVWTQASSMSAKIRISAEAQITNPNLYLAGAMGVIDPALPWKLVPFSFVVDWFYNVEQVISSLTPFLGVTFRNACNSQKVTGAYTSTAIGHKTENIYVDGTPPTSYRGSVYDLTVSSRRSQHYKRLLGLPGPTLVRKPFKGFSPERGAQAMALVFSVLGK